MIKTPDHQVDVKIQANIDHPPQKLRVFKLPENFQQLFNDTPERKILISGQTYSSFTKSKRGKNDETKQLSNILKRKLANYFDSIGKKLNKFEKNRVQLLKKDKACLKAFRSFYGVGVTANQQQTQSFIRIRKLSKQFFSSNEFLRQILTSPYLKNRKAVLKYLPIIQQAPLHPQKFTSWKKFDEQNDKEEKGDQ